MEPGKLRHSITIERRIDSLNDYGDTVTQWVEVVSLRASFASPRGSDYMLMDQSGNTVERTYIIRYNSSVKAGMRVSHSGEYFNILAVLPDPTNARFQRLMTKAKINV